MLTTLRWPKVSFQIWGTRLAEACFDIFFSNINDLLVFILKNRPRDH